MAKLIFSNSFPGIGRFRANLYMQRGSWAAAIRIIPVVVPDLKDLNLPPYSRKFCFDGQGINFNNWSNR